MINNNKTKITKNEVEQKLYKAGFNPDKITKSKDGVFTVKRGYFYRFEWSCKVIEDKIKIAYPEAIIVKSEDHYNSWPRNSFFLVAFKIPEKITIQDNTWGELTGISTANPDECENCGSELPDPIVENREGGYTESVTYCPCGATYTS